MTSKHPRRCLGSWLRLFTKEEQQSVCLSLNNDRHHYGQRLATMTKTNIDNGHVDKGDNKDDMTSPDIPSEELRTIKLEWASKNQLFQAGPKIKLLLISGGKSANKISKINSKTCFRFFRPRQPPNSTKTAPKSDMSTQNVDFLVLNRPKKNRTVPEI